jgi:hypothetical protein
MKPRDIFQIRLAEDDVSDKIRGSNLKSILMKYNKLENEGTTKI